MPQRDIYDSISPIDYRYYDPEVAFYLSENGFTRAKLTVEQALVKVLGDYGLCSGEIVAEVALACSQVTTEAVYQEEARIHHDIRALVNCIRSFLSDAAKPFVHQFATSSDIKDSANAWRYREVVQKILLPTLVKLEETLIKICLSDESGLPQIARTHGQKAVPVIFGFSIAPYISRLGGCIERLRGLSDLPGKFSGAVGAYNASSLIFDDPEEFEKKVLAELGLKAVEISTQIVPPEDLTRLVCEVAITAGVLANLADDMRQLQRSEIDEVTEEFTEDQVGSSTMPQKRNPTGFENGKSCWKIVIPRVQTVFMDQISEHQRDGTNFASARTDSEIFAYAVVMAKRLIQEMVKLHVNAESLARNLEMSKGLVIAEPLYIILASLGHPDAHEKVRQMTLQAQVEKRSLEELLSEDSELSEYLEKMTPYQREILSNPTLYTGIAARKVVQVVVNWASRLNIET